MFDAPSVDPVFCERLVEALLFMSPGPVPESEIEARLPAGADVRGILARLDASYADRGLQLVHVAGGWALRTAEDLSRSLRSAAPPPRKLSRAALESLAIIAYHQPVTRGEIEQIRGVQLGRGSIDALLEAGWIKPRGRKDAPGRPRLWVTTPAFLEHFGLSSLDDLPGLEELKAAGLLEARATVTTLAMRQDEAVEPDLPFDQVPAMAAE